MDPETVVMEKTDTPREDSMSKKSNMTDELLELLKEEEAAEEKTGKEDTSGASRGRRDSRLRRLSGKKIRASSARAERREKRIT